MMNLKTEYITADLLIVGGGTAGCYAARVLSLLNPDIGVVIAEKANVKRSGCLAAGVNALNAYITEGHTPEDYVVYAADDAGGIVRGDLLLSIARELNGVTSDLESLGLVILRDENGKYVSRGWRNIKINGENIKPLLASAAARPNVRIFNNVNITDLLWTDSPDGEGRPIRKIRGAAGFDVLSEKAYVFRARAVLIATGGAAGLYRPNNPGFSRHKMWYPPFNTGAGYAMGIRAGAEMTTFEMRFIALRCKDTIAPTGTIAQGVGARQVNSRHEIYEHKYGLRTSERLWGTVTEKSLGNGPCYLQTRGIDKTAEEDLLRAYLNMAPSQTLKWLENGMGPSEENVEIEGTEPYIVGGHTASGYWTDTERRTTIAGLYAAGDVAGGAPQKYVTGALAEAKIVAETINGDLAFPGDAECSSESEDRALAERTAGIIDTYRRHLSDATAVFSAGEIEEAMQKVMDQYAGGISSGYQYSLAGLRVARERIAGLVPLAENLRASSMYELLQIYEIKERLTVCQALLAHLEARRETRWHSFQENADYPERNDEFRKYVNSRYENGEFHIIFRPLIDAGERYEHQN